MKVGSRWVAGAVALAVLLPASSRVIARGQGLRVPAPEPNASLLGSVTGDLVFTAVTPCRIADTRVVGGPIAVNTTRSFLGVAVTAGANFTSQGGSATDCGVAAVGASSIAINVTAVFPASPGYATVYKAGDTRPLAASINFTAGAIVNNTVLVGIPNPLTLTDFTIYSFAQSDYVVDVVGYFSPPQATALQCVSGGSTTPTIAAGANTFFNAPVCPTGYQATTPYCWNGGVIGVTLASSGFNSNNPANTTFCGFLNTTASSQTVTVGSVCCRVPGR